MRPHLLHQLPFRPSSYMQIMPSIISKEKKKSMRNGKKCPPCRRWVYSGIPPRKCSHDIIVRRTPSLVPLPRSKGNKIEKSDIPVVGYKIGIVRISQTRHNMSIDRECHRTNPSCVLCSPGSSFQYRPCLSDYCCLGSEHCRYVP